jgi:hypothetical protein
MSATSKKNVIYLLRFSEGQKNNIPWRRDIAAWLRFHSLIGTETFVFGRDLALARSSGGEVSGKISGSKNIFFSILASKFKIIFGDYNGR